MFRTVQSRIMRNCWVLLGVSAIFVATQAQNPQPTPQQRPIPRPFTISPQAAAKLQQQQQLQHLRQQQQYQQQQKQLHQLKKQHHHLQQERQHSQPVPQQFRPSPSQQVQRLQAPLKKPIPQQPPKYVTRNTLDRESFQKPRFSPPAPPKPYQVKQQQQQQQRPQQALSEEEEDYYEDEEPDRLSLLLEKSKFECSSKKDGYYADETLNCEVFHYCQDAKKHSWMCPENMNFHQVHLICMPPSQDNICTKSTNYHFVNDYLYRPLNEKEAASTNSSLRYADRYYPQGYTPGMAIDELQEQQPYQPRAPQRFGHQNVFFNPESVHIPLNHRRPLSRLREQSPEYYDE